MSKRCIANTRKGKRCKRPSLPGSAYCKQHQPPDDLLSRQAWFQNVNDPELATLLKGIAKIRAKSGFHRNEFAIKAQRLHLINRVLQVIALTLGIAASGALAAILSDSFSEALMLPIAFGSTVAATFIAGLLLVFFSEGKTVKYSYAAARFFELSQEAHYLLTQRPSSAEELSENHKGLHEAYTKHRAEYIHTTKKYLNLFRRKQTRRRKRKRYKGPSGPNKELPHLETGKDVISEQEAYLEYLRNFKGSGYPGYD